MIVDDRSEPQRARCKIGLHQWLDLTVLEAFCKCGAKKSRLPEFFGDDWPDVKLEDIDITHSPQS